MTTKTLFDFDSLVEKHSREIFSYLWRLLHSVQEAEDALQETFLRAFKAFPNLKDYTYLKAWLYKIASNVAYTRLKQNKKHKDHNLDIDLEFLSSHSTPDRELENKEQFSALLSAIYRLPKKQRIALILRNFQEFDYDEIGKTLECSPESARANVYQAIKKLRLHFSENPNA
jgi:RNA polymerase sigma-70 factor (ECF subfamily)